MVDVPDVASFHRFAPEVFIALTERKGVFYCLFCMTAVCSQGNDRIEIKAALGNGLKRGAAAAQKDGGREDERQRAQKGGGPAFKGFI